TVIVRLASWALFVRARPDEQALEPWLKWFAVPQVCAMCFIASAPLLMLPDPSGHHLEILFATSLFVYAAALGGSIKMAPYRPVIPIALVPMILLYAASTAHASTR